MGKAGHAPFTHYTRHREITNHAIERLRQRAARDLVARSDEDVGNLLDRAIDDAIGDPGRVEEFLDDGEPSRLVDVQHLLGIDVRAVLRPRPEGGEVVVTVLSPDRAMGL